MASDWYQVLRAVLLAAACTVASGCAYDIEYKYNIPNGQADCPVDTEYRSGGANIRERSGGANIRERNGGEVNAYCEAILCPGGETPGVGDPVIIWHLDEHGMVVARKTCPAE
jgi:hypothetical protein